MVRQTVPDIYYELHPLRSLVTSVLGHFGLFLKVRIDQGPNCLNHFGTRDRSVHHLLVQNKWRLTTLQSVQRNAPWKLPMDILLLNSYVKFCAKICRHYHTEISTKVTEGGNFLCSPSCRPIPGTNAMVAMAPTVNSLGWQTYGLFAFTPLVARALCLYHTAHTVSTVRWP